jgi:hypothetical protein
MKVHQQRSRKLAVVGFTSWGLLMGISVRSTLTAGIAAVAASTFVVAPSAVPLPVPRVEVSRSVRLMATADPILSFGATADVIDVPYAAALLWSGVGVQLLTVALRPLPLIGPFLVGQVYGVYSPTVYFTNSLVNDVIDPVLYDPLNIAVWVNGIAQAAYTGFNSILSVETNELNLVVNFVASLFPRSATAGVASLPTPIHESVRAALAPVERLLYAGRTVSAETDSTIRAAGVPKNLSMPVVSASTDTAAATVGTAGAQVATEPTDASATVRRTETSHLKDFADHFAGQRPGHIVQVRRAGPTATSRL